MLRHFVHCMADSFYRSENNGVAFFPHVSRLIDNSLRKKRKRLQLLSYITEIEVHLNSRNFIFSDDGRGKTVQTPGRPLCMNMMMCTDKDTIYRNQMEFMSYRNIWKYIHLYRTSWSMAKEIPNFINFGKSDSNCFG